MEIVKVQKKGQQQKEEGRDIGTVTFKREM